MYKDKEKQKQANKAANKRYRDKQKGITPQGDSEGITEQIPEKSDTQRDTASQDAAQGTIPGKAIPELEAIFGPCDKASLQHYIDCPDQYVTRQEPERMNWGVWMDMDELKRDGFKCNRVAIPGDWDYQGCVTQEMIDDSHKPRSQSTTAAPVDAMPEAMAETQEMHQMLRELPARQ